jgi:hypothetical protein
MACDASDAAVGKGDGGKAASSGKMEDGGEGVEGWGKGGRSEGEVACEGMKREREGGLCECR